MTFESSNRDENWTPRGLASLIAKRQNSGDDAKYLLAPTPIESCLDDATNQSCTAAAGTRKKPKNHLRANREALKEKQRNNKEASLERQAREKLRLQKLEAKKQKLYGGVTSRVFDPTASSLALPRRRHPPSVAASHSSSPPRASPSSDNAASSENDFHIAFGRKVATGAPTQRPSSGATSVSSSGSRHKSYGKVPRYIADRKAKIEREEDEQRRAQENAPPLPGLVLMEESERLRTLALLEENEREAREALRNIPFRMNERKAARLRDGLQFRLKEIDDTRRIFSKDKVFVSRQNGD